MTRRKGWAPPVIARMAAAGLMAGGAAYARTGPLPTTLREIGRAAAVADEKAPPAGRDLSGWRAHQDRFQSEFGAGQMRRYAVDLADICRSSLAYAISGLRDGYGSAFALGGVRISLHLCDDKACPIKHGEVLRSILKGYLKHRCGAFNPS